LAEDNNYDLSGLFQEDPIVASEETPEESPGAEIAQETPPGGSTLAPSQYSGRRRRQPAWLQDFITSHGVTHQ
jgi:hypothetical protein